MLSFFWRFLSIVDKWKGKAVDYDRQSWYQCVDWAKQFVLEQYGIQLGSFWGSALNGWNTWSPFDSTWTRVNYQPNLIPEIGDIVFLNKTPHNPYGHVCVADNNSTYTTLCIIEENAGNGNWDGKWDNAITQRSIPYQSWARGNCLGWFHKN